MSSSDSGPDFWTAAEQFSFMSQRTCTKPTHLIVRHNRRGGRHQSKGVRKGFPDIIGQVLAVPEDILGTAMEEITHRSVVLNGEGGILPVHGSEVTEDAIGNAESPWIVAGRRVERLKHSRTVL